MYVSCRSQSVDTVERQPLDERWNVVVSSGMMLKAKVPEPLKRVYRRLRGFAASRETYRVREVDLQRVMVGGEAHYDAGQWAELIGEPKRASMVLRDSPHVAFLEAYRAMGEALFSSENFEQTSYFRNAAQCVRVNGSYFGQRTREGILAHARAFSTLYERIRTAAPTEVTWPDESDHSEPRSLPIVRETLTPKTVQIVEGHHRLAAVWVCGQYSTMAVVLRPPRPTPLQALVLNVHQTGGRRELYQPIEGPEFDGSWIRVRRCQDRFAMMVRFLSETGRLVAGSSVVDLACSYGWFVRQFSERGYQATGVDADREVLKIGPIAYGLPPDQLVQGDLVTFLNNCNRRYDVVLLLSVLHYFALRRDFKTLKEILRRADAITASCLFLDTGQAHERWWRNSLPEWDDEFIVDFVQANTSFVKAFRLGVDADNVGPFSANYARTLFAFVRA